MMDNADFEFLSSEDRLRNAILLNNMLGDFIAEVPRRFFARLEGRVRSRLASMTSWQLGETSSGEAWITIIPRPTSPVPPSLHPCLGLDRADGDIIYWRPQWGVYAEGLSQRSKAWQRVDEMLESLSPGIWDSNDQYIGWQWVPNFPVGDGAAELVALTGEAADSLADNMVDQLFNFATSLDRLFGDHS